jgi:hypothetical protein
MMIPKTNKSKFFTMMILVLMGVFSIAIFAQGKEESQSKLDQLKGKVEKITVKVDGKDVVFEGKEAQKIADQLRDQKKIKVFSYKDRKPGEDDEDNVMFFRSKDKKNSNFEFKTDDNAKKVEVENKDGKKTITVTITKDGKEETKTYEGEEAEKFLKDEKGMKHISVTLNDDENMPQDHMIYFDKKMGGKMGMRSGCCCCGEGNGMTKMRRMTMPGKGMKKMIIREDDNDKESVEKEVEKKTEKK